MSGTPRDMAAIAKGLRSFIGDPLNKRLLSFLALCVGMSVLIFGATAVNIYQHRTEVEFFSGKKIIGYPVKELDDEYECIFKTGQSFESLLPEYEFVEPDKWDRVYLPNIPPGPAYAVGIRLDANARVKEARVMWNGRYT